MGTHKTNGQAEHLAENNDFKLLPNPHKRYVIVPDAGHMRCLQKGHQLFLREISGFLKGEKS